MSWMLGLAFWRIESERCGDQRSEVLDVGAHHDDVARLERGIVSKQADEHFPQYLDLTIGAVRGMELHGLVVFGEEWSRLLRKGCSVGCNVRLQPSEQGGRLGGFTRFVMQIRGIGADQGEGELQLAYVSAEISEGRVGAPGP